MGPRKPVKSISDRDYALRFFVLTGVISNARLLNFVVTVER